MLSELNSFMVLLRATGSNGVRAAAPFEQTPDADSQFLLTYPGLDNPRGEVLLDNEHVVVQRFIISFGEWESLHPHPDNEFAFQAVGGQHSGLANGKPTDTVSISETGPVGWMFVVPASEEQELASAGDRPVHLVCVTLKGDGPIAPDVEHAPQFYPNIPLQILLENDRVFVQRVQVEPGMWEGVHSHPGNQIHMHIKGVNWCGRSGGVQGEPRAPVEDGRVGWMDAIAMSEGHEYGNVGDSTIDLIWVTLK